QYVHISTQCILLRMFTYFPYTTLFRSKRNSRSQPCKTSPRSGIGNARVFRSSAEAGTHAWAVTRDMVEPHCKHRAHHTTPGPGRSEEHTSELQSRENLVCRLLLEKKKQ